MILAFRMDNLRMGPNDISRRTDGACNRRTCCISSRSATVSCYNFSLAFCDRTRISAGSSSCMAGIRMLCGMADHKYEYRIAIFGYTGKIDHHSRFLWIEFREFDVIPSFRNSKISANNESFSNSIGRIRRRQISFVGMADMDRGGTAEHNDDHSWALALSGKFLRMNAAQAMGDFVDSAPSCRSTHTPAESMDRRNYRLGSCATVELQIPLTVYNPFDILGNTI